MGGYGSGRFGGRPTADMSKRIDIAWMIRTGRASPGFYQSGILSWTCGEHPAGSISYVADIRDSENAILRLSFTRGPEGDRESVEQVVRLVYSQPNFGGRRWWMICPYRHERVAKLYLPNGGDRFAGRKAWRLAYQCQRSARRDRPFDKLNRLQRKVGGEVGYEACFRRPKGMHRRTFERLERRYWELDAECAVEMGRMMGLLQGRLKRR